MKFLVRAALVLCVCIVVAASGWLFMQSRSVSSALAKAVQRGPGTTIDFAELAPFAWDRLYVFHPYTAGEDVDDALGFHWDGFRHTSIPMNDGVNLVEFVREGEVVYWFEFPRHCELGGLANPKGYAGEEARFVICQMGGRLELAKPEPGDP